MSAAEPHLDLAHLRALCDTLPGGTWKHGGQWDEHQITDEAGRQVAYASGTNDKALGAYLAAVSPDVVRALLDRLERAEADLDETRFCLGVAASRDSGLIQAIREAPRD